MNDVYITKVAKFLPNNSVSNDEMENVLGLINGKKSRARNIVLRNNKITNRYYAIDDNGNVTHNNAELTQLAIENLCNTEFTKEDIQLLSCGTSTPDQTLPSHTAMVHGKLQNGNMEINSASGVCCSGMNALKYAYMSVKIGDVENAVCTGSERVSTWLSSESYEEEVKHLEKLENQPIIAFEKDFLRWMLSDGAGAFLLQNKPNSETSLKIEWIDGFSYAYEIEACMYGGSEKLENGDLKSWSEFSNEERDQKSIFSIKQDVKLLDKNILTKGVDSLKKVLTKNNLKTSDINYYLPHISSYYFKDKLYEEMKKQGIEIPFENWFTNLHKVGNVGSASIYLMLEELVNSGKLKKGDTVLLSVPESARFSYMYAYLKVC